MATSLYIASLEPRAGKSVVALGLMELLSARIERLAYFRPVVPDLSDVRSELIRARFPGAEVAHAYTVEEVEVLLADGRNEDVYRGVLERFRSLTRAADFVLCDGTDYTGVSATYEFSFNAELANHLGAPVVILINGHGREAEDVVESAKVARESLMREGCTLAATIVNRVEAGDIDAISAALGTVRGHEPEFTIPETSLLGMPTFAEVVEALDAIPVIPSGEAEQNREITAYKIAAMSLPNFLDHVGDGYLVMVPGDRSDLIVGAVASRMSNTYANLAGLILTGGLEPAHEVLHLIEGIEEARLPIYAVDTDTFQTAQDVAAVTAVMRPSSERKISAALGLFERHVDAELLAKQIDITRSDRVTPLMFEYDLIERARAADKHIVLPEGTDDRILDAAEILIRRDVVKLTLLGEVDRVAPRIAERGLPPGSVKIIDPATSSLRDPLAHRYQELRSHRGIALENALDVMLDVNQFGTMMVETGLVDGMVSGAAHTTQATVRPALQVIKTRPGVSIVSSVFLMLLADRVLVYGDCAVNPNPNAEQLADIAISSAETAERFGIDPVVAMLSYSTGESGTGEDVQRVREATGLARERRPDLRIDGPIQYDAAIDASVGSKKLPESSVAGQATVFIFPDLNTGNNTYKAVQRSAGAIAVGPVLQGLNKPVNDLSRGCEVADIVNTVAITAIQAEES